MRLAAIAAGLIALLPVARLGAQSSRSLTDSNMLLAQGTTITVPKDQGTRNSNAQELQEQNLLLRSAIKSLTESLAIANSEAEAFKRQSNELSLRIEALGLAGVEKDQGKLEQRLLAAVRDLRLLKEQHERAVTQLLRLTEAIQVMMKNTEQIDPQVRMNVETELRKTNDVLGAPAAGKAQAVEATLNDAMIVDMKDTLALVVANVGEKNGVQIGMPFQVWRDNKRIGVVRVVDVRERICGAIIQSLDSEKVPVKTGDRLKADAKQ
jgi:hypothetical protein